MAIDGSSSNFSFSEENAPTYSKNITALYAEGRIVRGEQKKSFFGKLLGLSEDSVLAAEHDAAHVQWGCGWRMPTRQELNDLRKKCNWIWVTKNGVNGYIVRGRDEYASASIFLPAAGYGSGTSLGNVGSCGHYWSSVPYSDSNAWSLYFLSSGHDTNSYYYRSRGQPVRPVQGFTKKRTK